MKINYKNAIVPTTFLVLFLSSVSQLCSASVSVEIQENIDSLVRTNECVDCNLTGADLNRLNLSGADLRGADLSNATFLLSDLSDANMSGAILNGTQFGGADLAGADLRKADLRGVKLSGAYLVGCQFDGSFSAVTVSDDNAGQETVEKRYIPDDSVPKDAPEKKQVNIAERKDYGPVPPQINSTVPSDVPAPVKSPVDTNAPARKTVTPPEDIIVKNENIEAPGEKGELELKEQSSGLQKIENKDDYTQNESVASTLPKTEETDILPSPDAKEQPAGMADIRENDIPEKQEDAQGSMKEEAESGVDEISDTEAVENETEQKISEAQQPITADAVDVSKDKMSQELPDYQRQLKKYKKCYTCNLAGSDFAGKNFDGFDLEGSDFTGSNLEKADFEDANLKGVSFKNANLRNAKFNGADLYKADFSGADLSGAEFKKALVDETNFQDAIGYDSLMLGQPQ